MYVNISISNDAVVEQQETFGVRLSATDQSVNLTQDEATVTINDNTGRVAHAMYTTVQMHRGLIKHKMAVHILLQ